MVLVLLGQALLRRWRSRSQLVTRSNRRMIENRLHDAYSSSPSSRPPQQIQAQIDGPGGSHLGRAAVRETQLAFLYGGENDDVQGLLVFPGE